jgi:hypothetical protein
MGSAVRARQEKKHAKATGPARAQAPKKISPTESLLLVGIPIVFGLCVSYLFSRGAASGAVPRDAPRDTDFYAGAS